MGSLTGTNISTSYTSLLRVDDNTSGVDGAIEHITDGEGNATPLDISTTKFRVYPSVNANDTFNVTNATGETALVVNTSNKLVGIGGAPSADRHLEIHSAGNTYLQITSPSGDFNSALLFKHDSAQKGVLGWNDGQSALKLVYGTNIDNNTGIAIDTAGKVGIGTETPDYLLDVETTTSTARINSTGNTNAGLILKNTACEWFNYIAPTTGNWKLKDDTSDVTPITIEKDSADNMLYFRANGNVGIGTSSAGKKLDVHASQGDQGGQIAVSSTNTSLTSGEYLGQIHFRGQDADTQATGAKIIAFADNTWGDLSSDDDDAPTRLEFYTQSDGNTDNLDAARMTIDSNGYIGIGTNTPGAKLTILEDVASADFTALRLWNFQTEDDTSASVSIQMSPDAVQGNAAKITVAKIGDFNASADRDSKMNLRVISNNVMGTGLTCAGNTGVNGIINVGIGIEAPTAKLHVDQTESAGAVPVVRLDQGDADESFIDFVGTSADNADNSISELNSAFPNHQAANDGWIRIEVNGAHRWIPFFATPN